MVDAFAPAAGTATQATLETITADATLEWSDTKQYLLKQSDAAITLPPVAEYDATKKYQVVITPASGTTWADRPGTAQWITPDTATIDAQFPTSGTDTVRLVLDTSVNPNVWVVSAASGGVGPTGQAGNDGPSSITFPITADGVEATTSTQVLSFSVPLNLNGYSVTRIALNAGTAPAGLTTVNFNRNGAVETNIALLDGDTTAASNVDIALATDDRINMSVDSIGAAGPLGLVGLLELSAP